MGDSAAMSTEGSGNSPTLGVVLIAWMIWLALWTIGGLAFGALVGVAASAGPAMEPVIRVAVPLSALVLR